MFCILLFSASLGVPLAAKTQLAFATLAPKSSIWGTLIRNTVRDAYHKSDKELLIRVYYGGVQGDETEMKAKLDIGQLDGGFFTGNGLGALANEVRILEMPGLVTNYKAATRVYAALKPTFNYYFNQNGYELLGLAEMGFAYFYSQKPIHSISHVKETRMWLWKGDAFAGALMKMLNIPAIAVSFTEVLPSLQTGLIDGVYATPTALLSLEWQTQVNYMLDLPLTLVSSGIVLKKTAWDELSPELRKLLLSVINHQLAKYKPLLHEKEQISLQTLAKLNIEILPSQDNLSELTASTRPLLSGFPRSLQTRIQTVLATIP